VIPEVRPQLDEIVSGLNSALGEDLVGVYLHGSAVLDCMGPWSDIDLLAVVDDPLDADAKRRVAEVVLRTSSGYERQGPCRPVELDVVRAAALREWRHPAPFEFHYSESFRERFAAGEVEPWDGTTNRDLAAHVAVLRESGVALTGPPPRKLFPLVPDEDLRDALLYELEWTLRGDIWLIPGAIRNSVLTRARMWATLATGELHSKKTGAEWALSLLPDELRPVLEHARDLHTGAVEGERWRELPLDNYLTATKAEIEALTKR
jgi:predicted nucleotidyltransferase